MISMNNNSIVHFVGFVTKLDTDKFIPAWEHFAKKEMFRKKEPLLLQQGVGGKNKFNYLSQHIWPETEAHFSFKKTDKSGYFYEMPVQVIHIGGYLPLETLNKNLHKENENRLLVLAGHNENDPVFFQELPFSFRMNTYQAYYESCSYGYIFEYFAPEKDMEGITESIKQHSGTERILYNECLVPHI